LSCQSIPSIIYDFIQISVNFWNKVIPCPQNDETKYSIEQFSEGAKFYSQIINDYHSKQINSYNISNEIIFDSPTNSQSQFPNQHSQFSSAFHLIPEEEQNSDCFNQNFNQHKNIRNSNFFHESIISLISECFHIINPRNEEITNRTPFDKLIFLKNYLHETSSSFLEIIKILDDSTIFEQANNLNACHLILHSLKSSVENVNEICSDLFGMPSNSSISIQLQFLLSSLNNPDLTSNQDQKDQFLHDYFQSISKCPLIFALKRLKSDFSSLYSGFKKVLDLIQPSISHKKFTLPELITISDDSIQQFFHILNSIFQVVFHHKSSASDWLNSLTSISNQLSQIEKELSQYSQFQQLTFHQTIQDLLRAKYKFQLMNTTKNDFEQLKAIAIKIIEELSPNYFIQQNDLSLPVC
jgi:hypothetical protein